MVCLQVFGAEQYCYGRWSGQSGRSRAPSRSSFPGRSDQETHRCLLPSVLPLGSVASDCTKAGEAEKTVCSRHAARTLRDSKSRGAGIPDRDRSVLNSKRQLPCRRDTRSTSHQTRSLTENNSEQSSVILKYS